MAAVGFLGMILKRFEDLDVYQLALELQREICLLSKDFPKEERFSLTDQIRRSSRSVGANIAEAWHKRSRIHPPHDHDQRELSNPNVEREVPLSSTSILAAAAWGRLSLPGIQFKLTHPLVAAGNPLRGLRNPFQRLRNAFQRFRNSFQRLRNSVPGLRNPLQ